MRRGSRASVLLAGLCALALLAGACTNDSSTSGAKATTAGASQGVTDTSIKIGFPTIDQKALVDAGLATDMGDITTVAQAIVGDWNAEGGINGRKVELVPGVFGKDLANFLTDMQAICLNLTEDVKVFATVAVAWFGDAATCIAGDHKTPLVVQSSMPSTVVKSGDGNIFLVNLVWEDALASAVRALDQSGELDRFKKFGVFGPLEPGMREAIDDGLVPALTDAGKKLAADGTIPFAANLDSAAVAAVVSRFKAEGVDAVFPTGNFYFNGAFMTEAQRQGFHPTYVVSDLSEGTEDLILKFAPPEQLANAIGASWKGHEPDPVPTAAGKACVAKYSPKATSATQRVGTAQVCQLLDLTHRALQKAGASLTRAGFEKALEGIDDIQTSGGGTGGFSADDHTLPDQVRLAHFDLKGCKCWATSGKWIDVHG